MDDDAFAEILRYFNLSWSGYRKVRKGVKKRLARHMHSLKVKNLDGYLRLLENDPEIKKECENLMTVSISRFFRDRVLWEGLEREILPMLLFGLEDRETFKAWSCGCARGEEPYSFKIVWEKSTGPLSQNPPKLELRATDANPDYLRMAIDGIYEPRSLKEVPDADRKNWFDKIPRENKFRVKPCLRDGVVFERHDFFRDNPPSRNFRLVFARNNLLTYYQPPERDAALARIIDSLISGGVFIVGSHEKIPEKFSFMIRHSEYRWIYFKPDYRVKEKSGEKQPIL